MTFAKVAGGRRLIVETGQKRVLLEVGRALSVRRKAWAKSEAGADVGMLVRLEVRLVR